MLPAMSATRYISTFDLSPEELQAIEDRMRPGRYSDDGFLTADQSLLEVCQKDRDTLAQLHVTYEQIAARIDELYAKCRSIKGYCFKPVVVDGKFEFQVESWRGFQECPFSQDFQDDNNTGTDCGQGKGFEDIKVKNLETEESVSFPSLISHLIRCHQFFEGGPYRLDPATACRVLEIHPR